MGVLYNKKNYIIRAHYFHRRYQFITAAAASRIHTHTPDNTRNNVT
ncbi:hypothetical protein OAV88_02555 [bacterium]|nr:hypothetical protein [bacterium]